MARKTVRITIPITNPDKINSLLENVLKQHNELGNDSPLNAIDMALYEEQYTIYKQKRKEAIELHGQAEAAMQAANNALGISSHQNVETKGTLYNFLRMIKGILLIKHESFEEAMNDYGFNVVIGTAKTGPSRKKADSKTE